MMEHDQSFSNHVTVSKTTEEKVKIDRRISK